MKEYTLLANWKSWGTSSQIRQWTTAFLSKYRSQPNINVILLPSLLHVGLMTDLLRDVEGVAIGAQELSSFSGENCSGEVTIDLLQEYCHYYLIGHSFQRKHRDSDGAKVVRQGALISEYRGTPILCASNTEEIPDGYQGLSVFEPIDAISDGSGYGETAEIDDVTAACVRFRAKTGNKVFYGGSVNEHTITQLLKSGADGFLVGGASRDPERFIKIFALTAQERVVG
ncbi:MAG: Triosephosphate isomerase [Microgenomates bacterium OLB22]|nr:MAG: Triosephosphate isomerase [Microgenomates bacterium OLB22]